MKALLVFLGVFTFVTQAHSALSDEVLPNEHRAKVLLQVENGSSKKISIEPVLEISKALTGTTGKIQIDSGNTIEFDPAAFATKWGLGKAKITGFTVSVEGGPLEEVYLASKLKSKIRITDINLQKFLGRNN